MSSKSLIKDNILIVDDDIELLVILQGLFEKNDYNVITAVNGNECLKELEKDPKKARPNADISPLSGTKPQKHRLRVGEYRVIYLIDKKTVSVIEVFKRGRGYRK